MNVKTFTPVGSRRGCGCGSFSNTRCLRVVLWVRFPTRRSSSISIRVGQDSFSASSGCCSYPSVLKIKNGGKSRILCNLCRINIGLCLHAVPCLGSDSDGSRGHDRWTNTKAVLKVHIVSCSCSSCVPEVPMQLVSCSLLVVNKKPKNIGDQLDSSCVLVGGSVSRASSVEGDRSWRLSIKVSLEDELCLLYNA